VPADHDDMQASLLPQDRQLYDAGPGSRMASPQRNAALRERLRTHLEAEVAIAVHADFGKARGALAADWVETCRLQGLQHPGEQARTGAPDYDEAVRKQVDAAKTRLRQFLAGRNELGWVLDGLEATLDIRAGRTPRQYDVQGSLL
jgi:hypothetical protein